MEERKSALTDDQDLLSSVDWLTEVIHRFTDSYVRGAPPDTVNMDVLTHAEKVWTQLGVGLRFTKTFLIVEEVRIKIYRQSLDSARNGRVRRWYHGTWRKPPQHQRRNWHAYAA